MKRWIALPCVWAISVAVQAAPVGLGATVRAESATVYVPIEVSDSLRLEPFASYQKRHVVASGSTADTTDESKLLGMGAFLKYPLADALLLDYGARLAYVQSSSSVTPFSESGFSVEPSVGAEYFVVPRLSIGLEAGWYYRRETGNERGVDIKDSIYGTDTRLLVRFFFSPAIRSAPVPVIAAAPVVPPPPISLPPTGHPDCVLCRDALSKALDACKAEIAGDARDVCRAKAFRDAGQCEGKENVCSFDLLMRAEPVMQLPTSPAPLIPAAPARGPSDH